MPDKMETETHYTPAGPVTFKFNYRRFVCICTEEGKKEAEDLMSEVCERLKCTRENLVGAVVFDLAWEYGAAITGLHADMWAGVAAEGPGLSTFIQCDVVEHGVAATWKAFADKKNEEGEAMQPSTT